MAKNFTQPGDVISLTAPYAVASGAGLLVGAIFGVAMADAANGAPVEAKRTGVFTLVKATGQAWTVGQKLYWDNAAKNVTSTVGTNTLIGAAAASALSAATSGSVLLTGQIA